MFFFNRDSELHEGERNHLQLPLNLLFQGPGLKQSTRRLMTGHSGKHGQTVCLGSILLGVSQNEVCGTGSLPQGSVSRVCFGGLFRQSRTSQPYLKLHSPKKYKSISIEV